MARIIGTPGRIDGHQVKWSRDGGNFTFRDLTTGYDQKPSLIGQLADGWKRLRSSHPGRRVVVHLRTNEIPSTSKLIETTTTQAKASFAEFINQVWDPAHERNQEVPADWRSAWNTLVMASLLTEGEFQQFVSDCELQFGLTLPGKSLADAPSFMIASFASARVWPWYISQAIASNVYVSGGQQTIVESRAAVFFKVSTSK